MRKTVYQEEAKNKAFKELSKEENIGENHDQEKNDGSQVEHQKFHWEFSRLSSVVIQPEDSLNTTILNNIKKKERSHFQMNKIPLIILSTVLSI